MGELFGTPLRRGETTYIFSAIRTGKDDFKAFLRGTTARAAQHHRRLSSRAQAAPRRGTAVSRSIPGPTLGYGRGQPRTTLHSQWARWAHWETALRGAGEPVRGADDGENRPDPTYVRTLAAGSFGKAGAVVALINTNLRGSFRWAHSPPPFAIEGRAAARQSSATKLAEGDVFGKRATGQIDTKPVGVERAGRARAKRPPPGEDFDAGAGGRNRGERWQGLAEDGVNGPRTKAFYIYTSGATTGLPTRRRNFTQSAHAVH